jgi:hypothetical protein
MKDEEEEKLREAKKHKEQQPDDNAWPSRFASIC